MKQRKKKHTVLVVEDDPTSRKLLKSMLEKAGHNVIDCSEGRYAVQLAHTMNPAVMIIDVMLPDMEGTQIIEEMGFFPQCADIKCIFLTGILKKRGLGAKCRFKIEGKEYKALAKPILKSQLLKVVDDAIAESLEEQEEAKRRIIEAQEEKLRLREEAKQLEAARREEEKAEEESNAWHIASENTEDAII